MPGVGCIFYNTSKYLVGSWLKTTLVRRDRHDPGGVPLKVRGTSPYPALAADVEHEDVHKAPIPVSVGSV